MAGCIVAQVAVALFLSHLFWSIECVCMDNRPVYCDRLNESILIGLILVFSLSLNIYLFPSLTHLSHMFLLFVICVVADWFDLPGLLFIPWYVSFALNWLNFINSCMKAKHENLDENAIYHWSVNIYDNNKKQSKSRAKSKCSVLFRVPISYFSISGILRNQNTLFASVDKKSFLKLNCKFPFSFDHLIDSGVYLFGFG